MVNIEKNIKELCRRKGLTMSDVANRVGSSPSNLLSSIKGNPTINRLQEIATALQVDVSELLSTPPMTAQGIMIIDGSTYQIVKPAASTFQIPTYSRFDDLRAEVKAFIKKSIEGSETISQMGLVGTMEAYCLAFNHHNQEFILSLCYKTGETVTLLYDKYEFANWKDDDTEETVGWNLSDVSQEIINDIEGVVTAKIQSE